MGSTPGCGGGGCSPREGKRQPGIREAAKHLHLVEHNLRFLWGAATARFIARAQLGRVKRRLIIPGLSNKHARSFPPGPARQLERTLRRRGPLSGPLVFSRVGPAQNNGRMTLLQNVGKSTGAGRNMREGPPKARLVITALPAVRPIANGLGALRLLSVLAARELPRGFFFCALRPSGMLLAARSVTNPGYSLP